MNDTVQPVVTQRGIRQLAQYSHTGKKEQTAQAVDLTTQSASDAADINVALGLSPVHCDTGHWQATGQDSIMT